MRIDTTVQASVTSNSALTSVQSTSQSSAAMIGASASKSASDASHAASAARNSTAANALRAATGAAMSRTAPKDIRVSFEPVTRADQSLAGMTRYMLRQMGIGANVNTLV